jgi:hypothetical protein
MSVRSTNVTQGPHSLMRDEHNDSLHVGCGGRFETRFSHGLVPLTLEIASVRFARDRLSCHFCASLTINRPSQARALLSVARGQCLCDVESVALQSGVPHMARPHLLSQDCDRMFGSHSNGAQHCVGHLIQLGKLILARVAIIEEDGLVLFNSGMETIPKSAAAAKVMAVRRLNDSKSVPLGVDQDDRRVGIATPLATRILPS